MRTREELETAVKRGERPKYLFFWGHRPRKDGSIGKSCLSQWWPGTFVIDGITYGSAEHWMMAGKARLFGDDEVLAKILATPSAPQAKKLGRQVRGFDAARWEAACFELVVQGNLAKFGQDPALKAFLLGTKERVLVEASPHDRVWGIGMDEHDPRAADPTRWEGSNLLGFALMEVRERLRSA